MKQKDYTVLYKACTTSYLYHCSSKSDRIYFFNYRNRTQSWDTVFIRKNVT